MECAHCSRPMRFSLRKPKQYLTSVVKQPPCKVVVWLSVAALITWTDVAKAGPFRDFFRAILTAVAHHDNPTLARAAVHG